MVALDYLKKYKESFSRWDPVDFKDKNGDDCVAYLARFPLIDLDLAIVESDKVVCCDWFRNFSLIGYDGRPSFELRENLVDMSDGIAGRAVDPSDLDDIVNVIIENSFC